MIKIHTSYSVLPHLRAFYFSKGSNLLTPGLSVCTSYVSPFSFLLSNNQKTLTLPLVKPPVKVALNIYDNFSESRIVDSFE